VNDVRPASGADPAQVDRDVPDDDAVPRRRFGDLGSILGLLAVAWGAAIASFPLKDNSFFTHLATGRLILEEGSVPTSDPYTFTAAGVDWTVQSWLPSVAYAAVERLGGGTGLRLLVLAVMLVAAALLWRLTAAATSVLPRLVIAVIALLVVTGAWTERPYMVGVIGLAIVWLALEGAVRSWVLVPLLWIWANSHGSYPFAFVLIGTVALGAAIDHRVSGGGAPLREALGRERSVFAMAALGSLLAAIGPLGIEAWTFPLSSVSRSDTLSEIVEWQSPGFTSIPDRAFLVLVLLAFAGLVRMGSWRLALPALVFAGAAIAVQRNIVMAVIVLVPVVAAAAPTVGTLSTGTRPRLGPALAAVCACLVVLLSVSAVSDPVSSFEPYPAHAIAWLGEQGVPGAQDRMATQDFVGNLLEVLDGAERSVFVDDRADMFPADVFDDSAALIHGASRWEAVLETYEIDVVVWERDAPVGSLLAADPDWHVVFSDTSWVVASRRDP
jgi:hypothetical protein